MRNLIIIGGIHGAGKTYLARRLESSVPIVHLTASQIINWQQINGDPNNKLVNTISDNQQLLIKNLSLLIKPEKFYLLNGHFTLLNADGKIEQISEDTFRQIAPKALIVKTSAPETICSRLANRDGKSWNIDQITEMQTAEIIYAKMLAHKLKLPFYKLNDNQENVLINIINREFNRQVANNRPNLFPER